MSCYALSNFTSVVGLIVKINHSLMSNTHHFFQLDMLKNYFILSTINFLNEDLIVVHLNDFFHLGKV